MVRRRSLRLKRSLSPDSGWSTPVAFAETELSHTTHTFGNVGHRFSAYAKRGCLAGEPFAARGAISTQFVRTRTGWRISSMAWDDAP